MRILVLSWREIGNPRAGGAERVTFQHMRRWVASGHQVTLFTAKYPGVDTCGELDGIRVVRWGGERTVHLTAQHWYRRQRQRPDIVVDEVHGVPFGALAYAGVPVVGWIYEVARDIWFRMYPWPVAMAGRLMEMATLRWYAEQRVHFITDSRSTADDLAAIGVCPSALDVIEPGIDCAPLRVLPEKECDPTLIVLGRLVRMKGVADAIQAFARMHRQLPRSRLWIVGDGTDSYVGDLRALAGRLGLNAAVTFHGRVSEDEKYRLLTRAHILIHPSQREGWGINVIEANAMGTPTVAYRVPGLRDSVVHGETGLLCPYGQPDALAGAVSSLLACPDQYHAMQRNALHWSARFTWDAAAERSMAVLSQQRYAGLERRWSN